MKSIVLAVLMLISINAFANGQIATLINYESTAARPSSQGDDNVTSIVNTAIEYTLPINVSFHGGFSFVLGERFESGITLGSRYYSATPLFQAVTGVPVWSYIGGGISFLENAVYYPEAGFRIALSNASRVDVYMKILNSSNDTYDNHVMIGAGLTF
ncbi:hypothetical protein [Marinomonas sp. GJ51-6]|uniref:hypothetical protein n=1 Tax=Marinomonas sp. GJ51-6 TaxID=2992802 RepID=UPI002934E028|nr:hypothetical protein [Marinomonas sp. GJ51-6]WOD08431.1 hypothetical protein ONZ50_04795 [Marinomonas sp. GJ51-6]